MLRLSRIISKNFLRSKMYFPNYLLTKFLKFIILSTSPIKKNKPILNMIIKGPLRKKVIILIEINNIKEVMM